MAYIRYYFKLSSAIYKELIFQSASTIIRATSPGFSSKTPREQVSSARLNIAASKIAYSIIMILVVSNLELLRRPETTPQALTARMSVSVLLGTLVLMFGGIQQLSSISKIRIGSFLLPHPISVKEASFIVLIAIAKSFDIPALVYSVSTSVALLVKFRSLPALVLHLSTVLTSIVLALAASLYMGLLFSKIVYGKQVTTAGNLLLLTVWTSPFYLTYFLYYSLVNLYTFFEQSAILALENPLLQIVYPFPLTTLTAYILTGAEVSPDKALLLVTGLVAYATLFTYISLRVLAWVRGLILRDVTAGELIYIRRPLKLRARGIYAALILKDLRLALKDPGVFLVLTMPLWYSIVYSLLYGISRLLLFGISFILILYMPLLLSLERYFYTYSKTLPISDRELIYSKVLLASLVHSVAYSAIFLATPVLCASKLLEVASTSFSLVSTPASYLLYSAISIKAFGPAAFSGNLYSNFAVIIPVLILTNLVNLIPWGVFVLMSTFRGVVESYLAAMVLSIIYLVLVLRIFQATIK